MSDSFSESELPRARALVVRMDVTNRCNLSCIHCGLASSRRTLGERPSDMPIELFAKIAREVFPYAHTVALSCEAEPMMHARFDELLAIVQAHPGPNYYVTTNATLLTEVTARALVEAYITSVNVSIDGAREASFSRIRSPGRLESVIRGIEALSNAKRRVGRGAYARPRLEVVTTLMRSTILELPELVKLCGRWQVRTLTAQHIYGTVLNGLADESLASAPELSDRILDDCAMLCQWLGIDARFPMPFADADDRLFSRRQPTRDEPSCRAPWTMLRIRWNGGVLPCDLWSSPSVGNLERSSFAEIWQSWEYIRLRRGHKNRTPSHQSCAHCIAAELVTTDNHEQKNIRLPLVHTARA